MKMVHQVIFQTTHTNNNDNQLKRLTRNHKVGTNMIKLEDLKGMIIVDIAGRSPITSAPVNKYICVL